MKRKKAKPLPEEPAIALPPTDLPDSFQHFAGTLAQRIVNGEVAQAAVALTPDRRRQRKQLLHDDRDRWISSRQRCVRQTNGVGVCPRRGHAELRSAP